MGSASRKGKGLELGRIPRATQMGLGWGWRGGIEAKVLLCELVRAAIEGPLQVQDTTGTRAT